MFLVNQAEKYKDRFAIQWQRQKFSYQDILNRSRETASDLLAIQPDWKGRRVASLVRPSFDYVILQWGVWRAGGVFVPIPDRASDKELSFLFSDIAPDMIFVEASDKERIMEVEKQFTIKTLSEIRQNETYTLPKMHDEDLSMFLYTSGTTGHPKGVEISHGNLIAQIKILTEAWAWSKHDKILLTLPLYHVHGIVNILSCALASGATCTIHANFDPPRIWRAFKEMTLFMAVPTIYAKLLDWYDQQDETTQMDLSANLKNLRLVVSGSAPLSTALFEKWHSVSGMRILERYGMTETGMILSNPLNGERRKGTVGQPLPGVSVKMVDENYQDISTGESGEILVKGDAVFQSYWQREKETKDAFIDGWFKTGDMAIVEDGYYRLLGRMSQDIIKSAGHKISAIEIEESLRDNPKVKDVAVVAVPDDVWGEIICAAIVPFNDKLTTNDLFKWIDTQFISYKKPRHIKLMADFPRNNLGKVVKNKVQKMFSD